MVHTQQRPIPSYTSTINHHTMVSSARQRSKRFASPGLANHRKVRALHLLLLTLSCRRQTFGVASGKLGTAMRHEWTIVVAVGEQMENLSFSIGKQSAG